MVLNFIKGCVVASLCLITVLGNTQKVITGTEASRLYPGTDVIRTGTHSPAPSYFHFSPTHEIQLAEWQAWITRNLEIPYSFGFVLIRTERDKTGHVHYRYQQTLNGVPVENGIWIVHTVNQKVYSMNGLIFTQPFGSGSTTLTVNAALQFALNYIQATVYKWQLSSEEEHLRMETGNPQATYYPDGQKVYISTDGKYSENKLAYKFNIYAHKPLGRWYENVDAVTGVILNQKSILHDADVTGTAVTAYSGTQTIITDSFAGGFRLRETGRGNGINTYDMQTGTNYGSAVDFTDADNTWNNVNAQQDEVATDAHWGAEMTYDYFNLVHNRNSIDNAGFALNSYVHYDVAYSNAFWDGQRMTYGDGSGSYNPFTALDITGHEITHGLDEFTANLDYQDESGALNESFSDIFGTVIEWYAKPSVANWLMGENIGVVIRSMSNPNSYGDPDTYFGTNWAALGGADNGGVHTNSGVQNFWFYLLCNGGTGTNDNGDTYSVTGLGMNDAADIAFRNLTVYLTNTSQYADARFYAIQSAVDLFGACTPEVEATTNAWYAVGVGTQYVATVVADFTTNTTGGCANPLTVNFSNVSINGTNFSWNFGDGNTSTQVNPVHTYTANGIYTVSLIADGGLCGLDTLTVTNQIYVGQLPNPVTVDAGRCDPGTVTLGASGSGQQLWYSSPTGGTPLDTGNIFTTPVLGATTIYYVESQTGMSGQYVGPPDNSIGTGGYTTSDRWLNFDAQQPFTLVSAWIFANGAGNRTIELRNSAGTVLQSAVINCPNGASRITLNFNVPVGINLQLGTVSGTPSTLYRNSGGVNFPYSIPGLVSITGSNGGSSYYYYFYDWEIQEAACASLRVPVTASIASAPAVANAARCGPGNLTLSANGTSGIMNWWDAPTGGNLVNTGNTYTVSLSTTTSFYVEEDLTPAAQYVGAVNNTFGGGGYFNGDQHLVFDVSTPCTLVSVLVYANGAGNRTIELRNNSGTVIQSATLNIPNGQSRITLNFPLTNGTGFQLGWTNGSQPDLYRNNSGTPGYPMSTPNGAVTITGSSAGSGYYYGYYDWEIQMPGGCITPRAMVTGTINTAFDASITPAGPFCSADGPVVLSAADGGGTWSGSGIINPVTGTFDPGVAGTGSFVISYTISGTCGDTGTTTITVTNSFDATIASPGTLCTAGTPLNLNAADPGGTWSGTGITNAANGTFDPTSVSPGNYPVTYTISGVCGSSDTETITVALSADAGITVSGPFCENDSPVNLTATDTGGVWSGNGVIGNLFYPAVSGPGTHTVIYSITGVCGDADTVQFTVNALPDADITPPAGPYCSTVTSSTLSAATPGGSWSASCGTCITTAGVFNPAAAGVGNWSIVYTVSNGCGTSADTILVTVQDCGIGITGAEHGWEFQLMPNPAYETVQVNLSGSFEGNIQVEIMNAIGQLVYAQSHSVINGTFSIPVYAYSPGFYIIKLGSGGKMVTGRLVKK